MNDTELIEMLNSLMDNGIILDTSDKNSAPRLNKVEGN